MVQLFIHHHSSSKHLLNTYVSLSVGWLQVTEINTGFLEQRRNVLEGCEITYKIGGKVQESGFGNDVGQNILGESRWQALKKISFGMNRL